MIGFVAVFLALLATGAAAFSYFNSHLGQMTRRLDNASPVKRAFMLYRTAAAFISATAIYLWFLILTDQFQYAYVFGYSEKGLSLAYKLSAFWAGQEGSFLLWLVFHAVFGLIIARRSSTTPAVMTVYCLLQAVLLTILLAKSPFMMLPDSRLDGAGLNPLLMDPWMVIHPPIIFLGYAGLAVPFAYAVGGLLTNRHSDWIDSALPWALFSWCSLGIGIFVGGFWAYKVLGWGGYWAWDPVENASLVPWLVCSVMLHLFLLAKIRPVAIKAAYLATFFTFVLVLYGTFLTRSGILSDFSTHSFADEGVGSLLAALVALVMVGSLTLAIFKWQQLPDGNLYDGLINREFITLTGLLSICALATLIIIGMSTPLVTMLLGNTQNVSIRFYNTACLPLLAIMLVCLTLAPLVKWGQQSKLGPKCGIPLVVGGTMACLAAWFGLPGLLSKAVVGLAASTIIANVMGLRHGMTKMASTAHIGVAILAAGIITSSLLSQSQTVSFAEGETLTAFNQLVTYQGKESSENQKVFYQNFSFGHQGQSVVQTIAKLSKDGRTAAREPAIYRAMIADYYITPIIKDEHQVGTEVVLSKGETATVGKIALRFDKFGMTGGDPQKMRVYAEIVANDDRGSEKVTPELVYVNDHFESVPVKALGHYEIALSALNNAEGKIKLELQDVQAQVKPAKVDMEISYKPLISFVWLGCLLISVGTLGASFTRMKRFSLSRPPNQNL